VFKKPIKVRCDTTEELGRLLDWLRTDSGLSELNRQRYAVTAVMAMQYWENPHELMYFEVTVPYYIYKKQRDKFVQTEVIDRVLQQRVFSEILGRS